MKKIEEIEYKELKDTDFILTSVKEVYQDKFLIGFDVVYVNKYFEDKVKTEKCFRVKDIQILKFVMSHDEIHELSLFFLHIF